MCQIGSRIERMEEVSSRTIKQYLPIDIVNNSSTCSDNYTYKPLLYFVMSVILSTRDNKFYVIPRHYLDYWQVFASLQEATGCSEEDVIPVPLTSEEFDKWMIFDQAFGSDYIHSRVENDEEDEPLKRSDYNVDFGPLKRSDYEYVVRVMDPDGDGWKLYCVPSKDDVDLLDWFSVVGRMIWEDINQYYIDDRNNYFVHGESRRVDELGDTFLRSFFEWNRDYSTSIVNLIQYDNNTDEVVNDCIVLIGLLYVDWLNAMCPVVLDWEKVSWRLIVKLKLSYLLDLAQGNTSKKECVRGSTSQNVLVLCHDGDGEVEGEHHLVMQTATDDITGVSYEMYSKFDQIDILSFKSLLTDDEKELY